MRRTTRIDELKATGQLPSPTGVALAILRLTRSEDASLKELARVLKTDPALAGRVLKYANSVAVGARRPAVAVTDAVVRLGLRTVRQLALGFSVLSNSRSGPCPAFDYQDFWSRSLARAVASQILSKRHRTVAPEEAFSCGLLAQIGRLALASVHPDRYATVLSACSRDPRQDLIALEREHFAIDHNELSAALLEDWSLPEEIVESVQFCENPEGSDLERGSRRYQLARCLHLAMFLANVVMADETLRAALVPKLFSLAGDIGIEENALVEIYDEVVEGWRAWGRVLEVETQEVQALARPAGAHEAVGPLAELAPPPAAPIESIPVPAPPAPAGGIGELDESMELPEAGVLLDRDATALSIQLLAENSGNTRLRILAVDDSTLDLRLLTRLLSRAGHDVTSASNGREALRVALEIRPHLIVTDWVMPELDGLELCKALRRAEQAQEIYIILLTGNEGEEQIVEAFEAGVDDYVVKPFSPRTLMARMRAAQRIIRLQEQVARDKEEIRRYVAELSVVNRKLERAALTDLLTVLPNRRYAMQRLDQEWAAARRYQRPLSCMIADIDNFKLVNDTYGHDAGDAVLRETGAELKRLVRTDDVVCRFGGEEFLFICSDTDLEGAELLAERICSGLRNHVIQTAEFKGSIRVSVGVAVRIDSMQSTYDLIKAADQALYAAKRAGRDRVVVAESARAVAS